jgi:hypothetical protein
VYLVESGRFEPAGQIGGASDSLVLTSLASAAPLRVGLSHTTSPELVPVYDLTVGNLHNYFAAGVLVHNKERCWTNSSGCHVCADTTQICVPGTAGRSSPPVNVPRDAGPPVTTPPPNPQSRPKPGDSEDAGGDAG